MKIRWIRASVVLLLTGNLLVSSAVLREPAAVPLCERPFAQGEWATAVLVDATVSAPPAAWTSADLVVEVCAKRTGPVQLDLELPEGFAWPAPPPGFIRKDHVSRNPANFGCLQVATATPVLAALRPFRVTATIRAGGPGRAALTARALPQPGPGGETTSARPPAARGDATALPGIGMAASSSVFVTVGETPEESFLGFDLGTGDYEATNAPPAPEPSCDADSE